MDEFLTATLTFPTVLFTFTLVIVAAYWLLVLVGGAAVEWGDGDAAAPAGHDVHGLGGVPVTIVVSVLVTLAWFLCLIGSIVLGHLGFGGALGLLSGFLILLVAIALAVVVTRAVVIPLRRVFGAATAPVRDDFVGRVCVIRTSWVGPDFGQAELTSSDGSSAIIQVRQTAAHVSEMPLTLGVSAVVYDYDSAAETFWVAAIEEGIPAERDRLRLDEYKPRALSGFVRNRLLDEVYLPLIGDNLAKQLGVVGDSQRTDRSGLLLLISPPGYGKTTLMEYVASRLGLVLVKINGPALGHEVTSIDPAQAPNATARQELEKINFALELGNNVLLYLDDIQHTSPELLQKFISLCDGQRRMEGVWDGRTRTYDLRGKRFAVCMAGNPYTEQGKRFRIPDMLANRADVWNLGDVLSGRDDLFALSYIENALTANPVLAPFSARDRGDLEILVRMARGDSPASADQLTHPYSAAEMAEITAVLRKLIRLQEVVLATNRAYIASAAIADSSRTEPPFQLQGSYRNMNALAERVVPVMNDEELEALIDDHYLGEAQTLTTGAESNLLKLAELRGRLSERQALRWVEVKTAYLREQALGGAGDDPLVRAIGALGLLGDRIAGIESALRAIESKDPSRKHSRTP